MKEHPESAYRRGYQQGAWTLYQRLREHLPSGESRSALSWIENDTFFWRLEAEKQNAAGAAQIEKTPPPPYPEEQLSN